MAAALWHVYHVIDCRYTQPVKNKFVLIAHVDVLPMGFLINSRLTEWLQEQAHLLPCEAQILASEHSWLVRDSYVDCQDLFRFTEDELTDDRVNSRRQPQALFCGRLKPAQR